MSNTELTGGDELMLTKTQIKRVQKAESMGKGTDFKISKTQISHVVKKGGSLFSTLLSLGAKMLPMPTTVAQKVLPGLATGALSSLGNFGMDKILGQGVGGCNQKGGFLISQDKIDKLIAHKNLLTKKQKEQILAALQAGGQLVIKPTPTQRGGFIGTLLASIGIPMLLNALTGKGLQNRPKPETKTGDGLQNRPYTDLLMPYQPPPFIGSWNTSTGMGMGKKKTGKGLLLGKNSPFNGIPLLGTIL